MITNKLKNYRAKRLKGFSLLELLIYIAILSVLVMVVAGIFISISQGRGATEARNDVSDNLRFAIDKIAQDLRAASAVAVPATAGATSTVLTATASSSNVSYCVSGGRLRREISGSCGVSSDPITSDTVTVNSLVFTRLENTNPILSKTIVNIRIQLNISYNSSSPDWQHSESKETTIGIRN